MQHDCLMLVTDYGEAGGFVGVLHAVAFSIAPGARVIDVDHSISPQDVRLGALRLERTLRFMPPGVHVGIVDPGVGGERRPVALAANGGRRIFVGPDNGLLVWAVDACGGAEEAVVLDREEYWMTPRSATFDGRDVFVPVAAHLALGVPLADLGSPIDPDTLVRLDRPTARLLEDGATELEVIQVDGFGNIQLSGDAETADEMGVEKGGGVEVLLSAAGFQGVARYAGAFSDVDWGALVLLVDSDGCLALAVNCGSAAAHLGLARPEPGPRGRVGAGGGATTLRLRPTQR
jgi:hypothetical protein